MEAVAWGMLGFAAGLDAHETCCKFPPIKPAYDRPGIEGYFPATCLPTLRATQEPASARGGQHGGKDCCGVLGGG